MLLEAAKRAARHQVGNLLKFASGTAISTVPLGSMTLGLDDVEIAHSWIGDRSRWYDFEVIQEFESVFADWNGSPWAFSYLGGRVALSAAIYALDLQPGDEVIVPGYTCVVVPNAFHYAGVKPIYCDIELKTWGLDVASAEAKVTSRTKAILIQHLYGLVSRDYIEILEFARRHHLHIIEDCAHSTGAAFKGTKVGNRGDIGIYSSEQSKVFNTSQGGIAVTSDPGLAVRLRDFQRNAPFPDALMIERMLYTLILNYHENKDPQRWWRGDWSNLRYGRKKLKSTIAEEERGIRPAHYGLRMPVPIAAVGLNQLKKIDKINEQRRQAANRWDVWCKESGYSAATVIPGSTPVFLRYPVMVEREKKSDAIWAARELNVQLGVWFCTQTHPVPREIPGCPNALQAVHHCVNFPTLLI